MTVLENGLTIGVKIPHRMVADYFGYEGLTWYQDLIIYLMCTCSVFFWIGCRGISKSYSMAWGLVVYNTLYPRGKFVLASGSRGQSRLVITEKILGELSSRYPNVRREIRDFSEAVNETWVEFGSKSKVVVVTSGDSARGHRSSGNCYEEFRMIDKDVIVNILRKFQQNGDRRPRYKDNPKYRNYVSGETKKSWYISSGWWKNDFSWNITHDALCAMVRGENQAVMSMHWGFPVVEGFMNYEEEIKKEKQSSTFSQMWWSIENEGLFWDDNSKGMYSYKELTNIRSIQKSFKPIPNEYYLNDKLLKDWKKKNLVPKLKDEIRVVSLDIAVMGGENDNSVYTVLRLLPQGQRYRKQVVYIEHANNAHSETQSIRLKQLYDDFDADICVCDGMGAGISVLDSCSKVQYDRSRDKEYQAWTVFNREDMRDRAYDVDNALPLIYCVKADAKFNHYMATYLKADIENKSLELLVDREKAKDNIDDFKSGMDSVQQEKELVCFTETDLLIKEMTSLEIVSQNGSPYIKVVNNAMRKDRFSSLGMGVYYSHILESDLVKKKKKRSNLDVYALWN